MDPLQDRIYIGVCVVGYFLFSGMVALIDMLANASSQTWFKVHWVLQMEQCDNFAQFRSSRRRSFALRHRILVFCEAFAD